MKQNISWLTRFYFSLNGVVNIRLKMDCRTKHLKSIPNGDRSVNFYGVSEYNKCKTYLWEIWVYNKKLSNENKHLQRIKLTT